MVGVSIGKDDAASKRVERIGTRVVSPDGSGCASRFGGLVRGASADGSNFGGYGRIGKSERASGVGACILSELIARVEKQAYGVEFSLSG